jgi:outer membrane protein assembly factor BamB
MSATMSDPRGSKTRPAAWVILTVAALAACARADDWPQWRGPERSNISKETGLLKEWPEGGPPLVWKADGLGQGVASVAVVGQRIFTVGSRENAEYAVAVDAATGKKLWETRIGGPEVPQMAIMRWLSQRVPTVDGDRVYVLSSNTDLLCLEVATGKELWHKNYDQDFEGKRGTFGFCDHPLVDGDKLIITPGGKFPIVALNKKSGEVIWRAALPTLNARAHSVLIVAEISGVRQYINHLSEGLMAVAANDGKFLWSYNGLVGRTANTHAPIVRGDEVFYASGYGAGIALLKITRTAENWDAQEVYKIRKNLQPWLGSPVALGDHVYVMVNSTGLTCLEWATGKELWSAKLGTPHHTLTSAGGQIYVRDSRGKVFLVGVAPDGMKKRGEFSTPEGAAKEYTWTFPVVSGGRLYLRDMDILYCYNVAEKKEQRERKPPRPTGGVFVPTPPDIVEKMLDLAAVKKGELVCDLGCGDGRILVAAAKKNGARGYGIDIDPACVKLAREAVAEAKVGDLVTIEKGDLFDADCSKADVVALYLLPTTLQKLIPKFEKLKPGTRIVTHAFAIPGLMPDKVVSVTSSEDEQERKLYLWTVPLKKAK